MTTNVVPETGLGQVTLASFRDYTGAQRLVDQLSDAGFPVSGLRIVGTGVRTVERVTGRITNGRAAGLGALTGAWLGLLVGLLFGIFAVGPVWFAALGSGLVLGALWGALFGFLAHWASDGGRDFTSVSEVQAENYDVEVDADLAERARQTLGRL